MCQHDFRLEKSRVRFPSAEPAVDLGSEKSTSQMQRVSVFTSTKSCIECAPSGRMIRAAAEWQNSDFRIQPH
jgi:hypothetical protein